MRDWKLLTTNLLRENKYRKVQEYNHEYWYIESIANDYDLLIDFYKTCDDRNILSLAAKKILEYSEFLWKILKEHNVFSYDTKVDRSKLKAVWTNIYNPRIEIKETKKTRRYKSDYDIFS